MVWAVVPRPMTDGASGFIQLSCIIGGANVKPFRVNHVAACSDLLKNWI